MHGVLWQPFHVTLATNCLDKENKAVQEIQDGMVVGKEAVFVWKFI